MIKCIRDWKIWMYIIVFLKYMYSVLYNFTKFCIRIIAILLMCDSVVLMLVCTTMSAAENLVIEIKHWSINNIQGIQINYEANFVMWCLCKCISCNSNNFGLVMKL